MGLVDDTNTNVVFLAGLGRSGSTLFERMVAELPGVCSLGEVVHLWERALRNDERCGCGASFSACPFWTAVGRHAFGGWENLRADEVLGLQRRVDRNRFVPRLAMPWLRPATRADLERYLDLYERIYAAASQVSGADVVVDSSKHVSLAYCLRWARGIDITVAHMVRDSPGVAYSWSKEVPRPEVVGRVELMPRYGVLRVAAMWTVYNLLLELLGRLGIRSTLVRYEDVVNDPRAVLRDVADSAGLSTTNDSTEFVSGDAVRLTTGHTVAGNPMRFRTGTIPLRRDDAWRRDLPISSILAITTLTLPVRWRLGYLRRDVGRPLPRRPWSIKRGSLT